MDQRGSMGMAHAVVMVLFSIVLTVTIFIWVEVIATIDFTITAAIDFRQVLSSGGVDVTDKTLLAASGAVVLLASFFQYVLIIVHCSLRSCRSQCICCEHREQDEHYFLRYLLTAPKEMLN